MKGLFSAAAPGEGGSFISVAFCQKIATVPTGAAGEILFAKNAAIGYPEFLVVEHVARLLPC
ncbi:MAG: hypothetical protein ACLQLG_15295 [Thermoguttaceae bacterium]